jgi:hypothetical protein
MTGARTLKFLEPWRKAERLPGAILDESRHTEIRIVSKLATPSRSRCWALGLGWSVKFRRRALLRLALGVFRSLRGFPKANRENEKSANQQQESFVNHDRNPPCRDKYLFTAEEAVLQWADRAG